MTFSTVFDVSQQGYTACWFSAFGLVFAIVGALLLFRPAFMRRVMWLPPDDMAKDFLGCLMVTFGVVWMAATFIGTYSEYQAAVSDLETGHYLIAEGPVIEFQPDLKSESFFVNGHRFSYSDGIVTPGFHTMSLYGGPIRAGLYVRVTYSGNLILRLEVGQ